jgi:hypothetical protein
MFLFECVNLFHQHRHVQSFDTIEKSRQQQQQQQIDMITYEINVTYKEYYWLVNVHESKLCIMPPHNISRIWLEISSNLVEQR